MVSERSLDPDDWSNFANIAHRAVDDTIAFLRDIRERPAWQPVPEDVKERLTTPAPRAPAELQSVYEEFQRDVLPYPIGNIHPRYWGTVMGTGTAETLLADLLISTMNTNCPGFDQSATYVERQVVSWFCELFGFPQSASGVFVTGGTMANMLALLVARNTHAPFDTRTHGITGRSRLRIYASTETHAWIKRACNILGLGEHAIRFIPVDRHRRIDVGSLARAVRDDRSQGHIPFFVNGNAGTVNTGATDDLNALADYCERESLWFHVDGAFGAMAALAPRARAIVSGMERADSLAFDLHKWGYLSYEAGCVLIRDASAHRAALKNPAPYLTHGSNDGITAEGLVFSDISFELSRGFRALKPWIALKTYGVERLGEQIQQNIDQAAYLARAIESSTELELLAEAPLNVVCFRYRTPPHVDANALNSEIVAAVQRSGDAVFTGAVIDGTFAIRAAITNHRTTYADIDYALAAILREGRRRRAAS